MTVVEKAITGLSAAELVDRIPVDFWNDPLIGHIVASDATPKQADEYLMDLGWPGELAAQVRRACQLRTRFPGIWTVLFVDPRFPSLSLKDFRSAGIPGLPKIEVADTFQLGDITHDRSNWPLLCKEISLSTEHGTVTSLDETGFGQTLQAAPSEKEQRDYFYFWKQATDKCAHQNHEDFYFYISHGNFLPSWGLKWGSEKDHHIEVSSFNSLEKGLVFPRLQKHILIEEHYGHRGSKWGPGWDRIIICMRMDTGPEIAARKSAVSLGTVRFIRSIPIRGEGPTNVPYGCGPQLEVAMNFKILPDLDLSLDFDASPDLVRIQTGQYYSGCEVPDRRDFIHSPYFFKTMSGIKKTLPKTLEFADKIRWKAYNGSPVALNDIADLSLITHTPDRLGDLFIY